MKLLGTQCFLSKLRSLTWSVINLPAHAAVSQSALRSWKATSYISSLQPALESVVFGSFLDLAVFWFCPLPWCQHSRASPVHYQTLFLSHALVCWVKHQRMAGPSIWRQWVSCMVVEWGGQPRLKGSAVRMHRVPGVPSSAQLFHQQSGPCVLWEHQQICAAD